MREIEDNTNRLRDILVLGLEESVLLKWPYYPRQSIDSVESLSNYQWYFSQNQNKRFKTCIETQKTPNSQSNHEEEQNGRNQIPDISYTTKLQSSKLMVLTQDRAYGSMEQKSPKISICTYSQLIYDKGGKNIQWRKDSLFNKWCQKNWIATCKRVKSNILKHYIQTITQNKDLNVIPNNINSQRKIQAKYSLT